MKRCFAFFALALVFALTGCSSLRQSAHLALAADAVTTTIGVTSGLGVEANPMMVHPAAAVALFLARVGVVEYVNTQPEPQRTANLGALNSIWWGVSISNLLILAAHSTPLGLVVGIGSGWAIWRSTEERRLFAGMCATERETNPRMVCEYEGAPL